MSFDDLFALLLFVVFIGLPLLNRLQQRGRGGAPPGAPPAGRGRPSTPGQAPARPSGRPAGPAGGAAAAGERDTSDREARAATSERTSTPQRSDDDPFAELAKRLEEARRRVRDAGSGQASSSTSAPPASRTIATPAPPSQAIPDTRAAAQPRAQRAARDPFPKARPKPAAPRTQRPAASQRLKEDAPALEVERRPRAVSGAARRSREIARMQANELVALDTASFRKGMMWHLVLSDPLAYRNRRKPSPPPPASR